MKKNYNRNLILQSIIYSLVCAVIISSCKKFIEVGPPVTKLVSESVFANSGTATGAVLSMYADLNQYAPLNSYSDALLSDELQLFGFSPIYSNNLAASSNGTDNFYFSEWIGDYKIIYKANSVIEGLDASESISPAIKRQLTGEAYFTRAFVHFRLANLWGDIPLITTTDYKLNSLLSRTNKVQVYQQIISDLKQAENLLNTRYVNETDTSISNERIRPNVAAAEALLARVYLYDKKYDSAELYSTKVLSNPAYTLETNLNNVFLNTSQEAIWQVQSQPGFGEGKQFILLAKPPVGNNGNNTTISSQLWASFEESDLRKVNWLDSIVTDNPMEVFYFPFKYKVYDNTANTNGLTEYSTLLRLAEQYLIRAEARIQQGENEGLDDLNAIRKRADLPDYAGHMDKESILGAILHERQVELFTEWGHRWFDLKRTDNINAVMSVVTPTKGGVWNPNGHQALLPIPQSERDNDPNLSQNPGY